jgi:hypothetical protein
MSPAINKIVIIPYAVHTEKRHFYLFGLLKSDELSFPFIELEEMEYDKYDIIKLTDEYLKTELSNYHDVETIYRFEEQDTTLYLYYEIKMNLLNSYTLTNSKIWFATIHEIINTRTMCNIQITEETTSILKKSMEFFSDNNIPSVYYDGSYMKKMSFESLFGCSKKDGAYRFYDFFTSYENAYSLGKQMNSEAAVLRYAVFADSTENCEVQSYDDFIPLSLHPIPILSRNNFDLL